MEKGYKVARIEQTETPAQLEERNKMRSGPKDKVVLREVCQLTTKGTRVNTFLDSHNFEGDPSYLLALCERPGPVFGVAFVDTTLGCFHLEREPPRLHGQHYKVWSRGTADKGAHSHHWK